MSEVRVRFAPSPTGYLHIGGLRTALYNYLYARHMGGKMVLRIEDTDRTRYVPGALENLIQVLQWAGIDYDEGPMLTEEGTLTEVGDCGPYIQSDRKKAGIYDHYINELLEKGYAYYCFCSKERLDEVREAQKARGETPRYDGHCRDIPLEEARARVAAGEEHVIRLKLPKNYNVHFKDAIKGEITVNTDEMDDQVLIKSDGFPTYHFAVVVDDHLMGITHIVRGEEWVSSTPKHVIMYKVLGWEEPVFVHLPTVLGSNHKKLSKRQGDVSVESFIEKGYLRDALVNYIALVGWTPKGNQEILTMEEMIKAFDFDGVSKTGGIFDVKKLNWVNQEYIKKLPLEEAEGYFRTYLEQAGLIDATYPADKLRLVTETYQNRVEYFAQVPDLTRHLFQKAEEVEYGDQAQEALKSETAIPVLTSFENKLNSQGFGPDFAQTVMASIQEETGIKGKKLWFPARAALVGETSGPDFTNTLLVLGEEEIRNRLARVKAEFFQ